MTATLSSAGAAFSTQSVCHTELQARRRAASCELCSVMPRQRAGPGRAAACEWSVGAERGEFGDGGEVGAGGGRQK